MEIFSPKSGDVTKFKLNVLNSDNEQKEETVNTKSDIKIRFVSKKKENMISKLANSCVEIVKRFFEYEEVV